MSSTLVIFALLSLSSCSEAIESVADVENLKSDATGALVDLPDSASPAAWSSAGRILFLHRSVGFALIRSGEVDMYDVLASLNSKHNTDIEMWHHGCGSHPYWDRYYDGDNLQVIPNFGSALSEPLYVNPEHWEKIFCDPDPQYVAVRDSMDNFRVIIFKSGYDNTVPQASDKAEQWRESYRAIKNSEFFADTTKRFILLGFPPIREGLLNATEADADSSRAFNEWLVDEFVMDRDNLYSFPLFDEMAGQDNWLKDEYEKVDSPNDSHPNPYGCEIIGRALMKYLHSVARLEVPPVYTDVSPHSIPVE